MTTETLDLEYVRAIGEDVRARLFPRPKQVRNELMEVVDGPTPVPLPTRVAFDPYANGDVYVITFTQERSIQHVNQEAPDVSPTMVEIVIRPDFIVSADLTFGKLPQVYGPEGTTFRDDLMSLLKAVTGVL